MILLQYLSWVSPRLCRVVDDDWHARYTAVDMIITAVTTPAPTEYATELVVAVVFEVPFVLVEGPVTTG